MWGNLNNLNSSFTGKFNKFEERKLNKYKQILFILTIKIKIIFSYSIKMFYYFNTNKKKISYLYLNKKQLKITS